MQTPLSCVVCGQVRQNLGPGRDLFPFAKKGPECRKGNVAISPLAISQCPAIAVLPGETGEEHDQPRPDVGNRIVLLPTGATGNRSQFRRYQRGEAANQSTRQHPTHVPVFVNPVTAPYLPPTQAVCRQCCGRHPVCPRSGCQGCPAGHRMHQTNLGAYPAPRTR